MKYIFKIKHISPLFLIIFTVNNILYAQTKPIASTAKEEIEICQKPLEYEIEIGINTEEEKAEYNEIVENRNQEIENYSKCIKSQIEKLNKKEKSSEETQEDYSELLIFNKEVELEETEKTIMPIIVEEEYKEDEYIQDE